MGAKREGEDLVRELPGTGGDVSDGGDVEGHRALVRNPAIPEDEGEGILARRPFADDEDVEGHRALVRNPAIPEDEGEGILARRPFADDDDVEGHLYRNLPTTQGEIARRGPGENPHGER